MTACSPGCVCVGGREGERLKHSTDFAWHATVVLEVCHLYRPMKYTTPGVDPITKSGLCLTIVYLCWFRKVDTCPTLLGTLLLELVGRESTRYSVTSSIFPWIYSFSLKRVSFSKSSCRGRGVFLSTEVGCGNLPGCLWSCFSLVCSLSCSLPQEQSIKGEQRDTEDFWLVYLRKENVGSWGAMCWLPNYPCIKWFYVIFKGSSVWQLCDYLETTTITVWGNYYIRLCRDSCHVRWKKIEA